MYGFAYSDKALDFLGTLQPKIRRQITNKVTALADNPKPPGCKLVLTMEDEGDQVYRIRSGDYRVLYVVRDVMIVILDIDHRKDVYK